MPFVFTISNNPSVGDTVNVHLIDGNGSERDYSYLVQSGDSVNDILDSLQNSINTDIYFVAIPQTVYAQDGLSISQIANVNYGLFAGEVTITYGPESISPSQTISFDEESNVFESFLSYHPEMMTYLGPILVTFYGGDLYTHDSEIYNRFYEVDYESYITPVFNESPIYKKTWQNISEVSSGVWDCPIIYTNLKTYADNNQTTNLIEQEFRLLEGNPTATIKRDINSPGGKINGQFMKGNYCVIKFRKQIATELEYISSVSVSYINSPLNRQ